MTQIKEAINAEEDVISTDVDVVPSSIIIGNLRRINTDQHKTIDDLEAELRDEMQQKYVAIRLGVEKAATVLRLNETISDLRTAASDMLDTINECSRREAEDSRVLMQVVGWVKQWDATPPAHRSSHLDMRQIAIIVEDYLDAPETPVVTLKEVKQHEETINELKETLKLERIDHTAEKSAVKKTLHETITKLKALNKALRIDVADRDRHIEELTQMLVEYRKENNDVWYKINSIKQLLKPEHRGDMT